MGLPLFVLYRCIMGRIVYLCVMIMYVSNEAKCDVFENCTCLMKRNGVIVNCSSQGLTTIPDFCQNTQALKNVSERKILINPHQIMKLDLSNNDIKNLSDNPFHCLENLKDLNLERNRVQLSNGNYFKGLFSPLVSLRSLNIKHNSKNGFINDTVFAELKELDVLRIDTPNGTVFGKQFSKLRKLHNLDLSGIKGYCYIRRIEKITFRYFPFLRILDLSACMVKNIDVGAFGFLEHLSDLFLSYNIELGFQSLQNITFNLQYTNIQRIHLENIRCFRGAGTQLCQSHLENLSNTTLKELNLAGNRLEWMDIGVIRNLPKNLRKLSLANNRLSLGLYSFEYRLLKKLTELNVSFQLNPPSITQKLFQKCNENQDILPCSSRSEDQQSTTIPYKIKQTRGMHWMYEETRDINSRPYITFYSPPKLELLYWSDSRLFGKLGEFGINAVSLRKISMQNNIWYSWIGPIHGVEVIEEFDLSQNFCNNISTEFLSYFYGVKTLKFGDNNLAKSLSLDSKGLIFRNQRNLEFLDLSNNGLEYLPGKIFKNVTNIKHLFLQGNRLYKWGVRIKHMRNLTFLDLSGNRIETLTSSDMSNFGELLHTGNLTVDLTNNRLSCTCENINFLQWIITFSSHFKGFSDYFCLDESGQILQNLQKSVYILNKQCKSYMIWYVISCIGSTLVISITACYLVYKNRWKIRYLRYIAKKKFKGYHRLQSTCSDWNFEFDAYISYSAKDLAFVKEEMIPNLEEKSDHHIRLAIMHRDMEPCGDHANNIMDYISRSKRTICVVSRNFLESDWQDYELNMARMEGVQARKKLNFVHLILMPDVCKSKYLQKARDFIKKGYYLEYPEELFGQPVFWESLRQEIEKDVLSTL